MGIHYDYKSTRGAKAMEKQAKREKKLAEKRAKKQAKTGFKKKEDNTIPLDDYFGSFNKSRQKINGQKIQIKQVGSCFKEEFKKKKRI
jgi:hypothetical protein